MKLEAGDRVVVMVDEKPFAVTTIYAVDESFRTEYGKWFYDADGNGINDKSTIVPYTQELGMEVEFNSLQLSINFELQKLRCDMDDLQLLRKIWGLLENGV